MRSSDTGGGNSVPADLATPMRQSYAAILLIAYKLYKVIIRQLFPFLLIFFFGGSLGKKGYIVYYIIVIAVLGFIYSIVAFFKYYFYLKDDKLVVQKGVFKRTKMEIPFDRIQSINFEQNLIHRVFNVVKLNMDTAGSAGSELQINALDHTLAKRISDYILEHRSEGSATHDVQHNSRQARKVIFSLSVGQLLKVGITENHLKSGGVIILFFFWIWESLSDVGMNVKEELEDYAPVAEAVSTSVVIISALVILFMLVSFLISLIRTVLRYYGLQMFRIGDGFVIESGLFNRREHAAKDHKIQLLSWSQNLLQKWSSIFELRMKQASSMQVSDKKSISVAGLEWQDVMETKAYLFKEDYSELINIETHPVHSYYRYRRLFYWTLFVVPVIVAAYFIPIPKLLLGSSIWYCYGLISTQLSYQKKRWGFSDNMLLLRGGTFGDRATMLQLYKVQNVSIHSTPFQRRRSLASITFYTASGQVTIPDIDEQVCQQIQDYLIYKVESSERSWM